MGYSSLSDSLKAFEKNHNFPLKPCGGRMAASVQDWFPFSLEPAIEEVIKKVEFTHPFYDMKTINAQRYLPELQGVNNSYFCGSYFGYGFHEDGLNSAIDVSNKL